MAHAPRAPRSPAPSGSAATSRAAPSSARWKTERDERSASLVSLQRVEGRLGSREGAFLLRGSETVEKGRIKATWSVVPGSGTGDLAGLRGEGGFRGEFGKESIASLTYWFE